jgi:hypothetical protein
VLEASIILIDTKWPFPKEFRQNRIWCGYKTITNGYKIIQEVEKPLALFEPPHTAIQQMAFANKSFGFGGEAVVAEVGAHGVRGIGQNVVRVNIDNETTTISDFLTLKNPNEANSTTFRPTGVEFSQNGTALYIADWGNLLEPPPGG